MNPLAEQQAPPQPMGQLLGGGQQGQPQGNPLARLVGQMQGPPPAQPAPSAVQTTAAVKRFGAVMNAMRTVLANPDLGRKNVRPAILDQASKLMASRVLSLPEVMNAIGKVTDDPLEQKALVSGIYNQAQQAEGNVLAHHAFAVATGRVSRGGGEKYQADDHDRHMTDLLLHYPRA